MLEEKRSPWERVWARIFGDGTRRPARIERVVEYVAHRLGQGARLEEAIQDEYVRRQTSPHQVEQVVSDLRIVEAARGRMHREFGSEEMSPRERSRRGPVQRPPYLAPTKKPTGRFLPGDCRRKARATVRIRPWRIVREPARGIVGWGPWRV